MSSASVAVMVLSVVVVGVFFVVNELCLMKTAIAIALIVILIAGES